MFKNGKFSVLLTILLILILGVSMAACGKTGNEGTPPVLSGSGQDSNGSSEEKKDYNQVNFTIKVERIGKQERVNWHAEGEVFVTANVPKDLGSIEEVELDLLAFGGGVGVAGFESMPSNCQSYGGWPTEYDVKGTFNPETCTLKATITEIWPKTEAYATCGGGGAGGGEYRLVFSGIVFTEQEVVFSLKPKTQDMITWTGTMTLTPAPGADRLDCLFSPPPIQEVGE